MVLARADARPLIIERNHDTGDALCGGFLSWRTISTLEKLGIAADRLGRATVDRMRIFAGGRHAETRLPKPAKGVSRRHLDALLLEAAEHAGAAVERGIAVRAIEADQVRLDDGAMLSADAILLATGKHDVRGVMRPAPARGDDPAIGLRTRFGPASALSDILAGAIELHLFDRGYAGLMLQEDGSANLCMAVHRSRLNEAGDAQALITAIGRESPQLGDRLAYRNGPTAVDAIANVPYGWRARETRPGLFRLGDQAGVIPSLAGEGMGIAVASGVRAASALLAGGGAAAAGYQRDLANALRRPLAIAGAVRDAAESPRLSPWLVRTVSTMPILADAVARLTRINHSVIDERSAASHIDSSWTR